MRDRFISIDNINNLEDIARLGNTCYVVDSIPLAIAFANKVEDIGIENMYKQLILAGGDTDTNCAIAGQIAGTLLGKNNFPINLISTLKSLPEYEWINTTILQLKKCYS